MPRMEWHGMPPTMIRAMRVQKSAYQDRVASSPLRRVEFHVRFGDPAREISRFADQLNADLIVMCSHGRKGLTRLVVGSVAERVVRLTNCPVLILK